MSGNDPQKHENQTQGIPNGSSGDSAKAGYEVGYRRPPEHSRFKPGQSGNPKGRPLGSANVSTMIKRVVHKKVSVRQGEKTQEMAVLEAMLHAHAAKGVKGDARSAGLLINLLPKARLLDDEHDAAASDQQNVDPSQAVGRRPSSELFENLDLTLLSDDEMIELSRLAEIVDLGGGMTALNISDFARARDIVNKGRGKDVTPSN